MSFDAHHGCSRNLVIRLRAAARDRQKNRCHWCGRQMRKPGGAHPLSLTLDLLTPRSAGGLVVVSNSVAACFGCNSTRHPERAAKPKRRRRSVPCAPAPYRRPRERRPDEKWDRLRALTADLEDDIGAREMQGR